MFRAEIHKTKNIKNSRGASDTAVFERCSFPLKIYSFIHSFFLLICGTHAIIENIAFDSVCTTFRSDQSLSRVQLFVTLWIVAHQALLSMGFSRQEHWNVLLCLAPGDLPDRGIIPISLVSHALTGKFFTISTTWLSEPPGKLYQMPINLN